jgi:RNA polymerase sigma-70 factor, ECF subfamily
MQFNVSPLRDGATSAASTRSLRQGKATREMASEQRPDAMAEIVSWPAGRAGEDWKMVQRARRGDLDAMTELFAAHRRRLFHTAFSLLRNEEDAEDALQDAMLSAYTSLHSFQGRSQFSSWLTRIVINASLRRRQKNGRRLEVPLEDFAGAEDEAPAVPQIADPGPSPERLCSAAELRELINDKLGCLTPRYRLAIELCDVHEMRTAEAARAAGIHINALKSRVSRARKQLADRLSKAMQTPATKPIGLQTS